MYIKEFMHKFDVTNETPISVSTKMDLDESGLLVAETRYKQIIDSLMYIPKIHPNIVYSIGLCDKF